MLSAISSPRFLTPVKPDPLQPTAAKSLLDANKNVNGLSGPTPSVSQGSIAQGETASSATNSDKASSQKGVQSNQKTIVDQRTTDAGPVKITVIAYSDGSSDTLREIKGSGLPSSSNLNRAENLSPSDKGLVVDKLG
ncbi:hypothetical protein J2X47_004120 [Sphingomonas sp. BE270]|jgi:hypothetical protein|uniref:hypothetical protein n=1 Tax=Sphingomonas sp. BE270 TaxID=2817726 RepID=UPI00285FBDB2|nr:hypothetical protein [Sphingomonas sp. BE270]MDR7259912.1 hypothetical protein [Sphingomonas sp. BE270]